VKGKYQYYDISSFYNKETKKSVKTKTYIGTINEDGLKEKRIKELKLENYISEKFAGQFIAIKELTKDILENLEKNFKDCSSTIYTMAVIRVIENCPLKDLESFYEENMISNEFQNLSLSGSSITYYLKEIGTRREKIIDFMNEYISKVDTIIFDGTSVFSNSVSIDNLGIGHNHHGLFEQQYGLMFGYSLDRQEMVYYKIFEGSLHDNSVVKDVLEEIKLENVCFIADKGFSSMQLFKELSKPTIKYIVPLKRNSMSVPE
jgi:transposase